MLAKVTSLFDLFHKAKTDKRYELLAIAGARNLSGSVQTLDEAKKWLDMSANDVGDCRGVVEEVNFCRDLVEEVTNPQPKVVKKKPSKFKVIKYRDIVDPENYRVRFVQPNSSVMYANIAQSIDRLHRQAQETGTAILTAQQGPAEPQFLPIADDFILDNWSLVNQPTDPAAIIQSNPCVEGIISRPESPYRA
jgi:hypothetical protein